MHFIPYLSVVGNTRSKQVHFLLRATVSQSSTEYITEPEACPLPRGTVRIFPSFVHIFTNIFEQTEVSSTHRNNSEVKVWDELRLKNLRQ